MQNYLIRSVVAVFLLLFSSAAVDAAVSTVALIPPLSREIPRPSKYVTIDYSAIDTYARSAPESAARNLNTLSDYLTRPARTELAKARSVYTWITSHIRYDETMFSGQRFSSEVDYANRVLRNRRGVCTGFALLYKYLLSQAGIEVANVKGYSRTNDSEAGQPIARIDHEWNAVRLDGDWYLLDIAWAQTTARPGPDGQSQPNDFYFLTEPALFGANHFPADPRWQLLNQPVSKAQFDQYPKLYDSYFQLGFDADFPRTGTLRTDEVLTLTLRNPEPVEFLCSMGRYGGSSASHVPVTVRQSGDTYQLTVPVNQRGQSTLYVFAKTKGPRYERTKSYEGIASFTVIR